LRSKVGIRFCINKTPKKIRAAIPYLTKARDRGSLSSIIKRVNTTVMPPRDVESDAQKTPQITVLRPEDDTEDDEFINCWYGNGYFRSNGQSIFGQAKFSSMVTQKSFSI
jgi:transcriptional regulator of nitric oxide reductase